MTTDTMTPAERPNRIHELLRAPDRLVPEWLIALVCRLGIAGVFFLSARTKVDGVITLKEETFTLFRYEYNLPLLPPEIAAYLATYAEHILSIALAVGLMTRLSAAGLMVMTLVIQTFVYPDAWPTHLVWAGPMIYLIGRGGGALSADRALRIP
ncbi:MAG: DoxX family protein [Hyphomonadaceae bacterium]